ncbi:MAG: HAMP domain-containing protein [Lachnospiraceae bacterium]|nr:HAMP domain-containing protein [Lachnospiraceae bacterium]
MDKKSLYGIWGIVAAAVIAIAAASLYGRTIKLNYIEQIHLQDGYLYYVDRGKSENLKIIRSDPEGKQGSIILCKKHDRETYRTIRQIFFDRQDRPYVLVEETNVRSWDGVSYKIYQCDFARSRLEETVYDLTEDAGDYSRISIQCIRDGSLYYIGVPDLEKGKEGKKSAELIVMDQQGNREKKDEIPLEYPHLNTQFFLSEDQVLLWTDYQGEIYARKVGTDQYLEISGITGERKRFRCLSDDGKNAYVLDYEAECIRCIDLSDQTSQVIFSQEKIQEKDSDFTFQRLHSPDCTQEGFCAGVEDEQGKMSVCSYQNGRHQDVEEIFLVFPEVLNRMFGVYVVIILAAALLCMYWLARVKYQFQTILVRLCLVFLLGLLVMDGFLEYWIEGSMRQQLEGNQIFALSAMGKLLREDIIHNIETDAQRIPSGNRALMLGQNIDEGNEVRELSMYVYSIFEADEKGRLYVRESMSEYSGVPVEWVYAPEVTEEFYRAYDSGESVNKSYEGRSGKRNNQFIPLILGDGTKYGMLVVSADGNLLDYQIWYYQWNLKNVSSTLLLVLTIVLLIILYIFLRPLKTLKEYAGRLAAGELGATVEVRGHDEVADISLAFNQMSLEIAKYVQDIKGISDGYYKFIPAKILDLLDKESIQDVNLGDQTTGDFTILSLHAVDYPRQRASLSSEQVYTDVSRVLSVLVEPINSHCGVVEHFEDMGLSAFFTVSSKEALDAAITMQRLLERLMPGKGRTIAISYGRVMIGVIGHEQRMEATTISAHSDLAKALRMKGDKYGAHILITHLVYNQIPDFGEHYHARYLGNIYLAANNTYERIYDVYDGDSEEEFYYKELTKPLFEQGVELFVAKKFYEARLVFVEVLKQHRKDKAAKEYLYRCDRYYKLASEEEIETVIEKF